jgi:hypothetical protein
MNLAELFKFGSDWMDDLISREELSWAFHIVNAIKATSDEMTGELNFDEFLQTLVYVGIIAFWDSLEVYSLNNVRVSASRSCSGRVQFVQLAVYERNHQREGQGAIRALSALHGLPI